MNYKSLSFAFLIILLVTACTIDVRPHLSPTTSSSSATLTSTPAFLRTITPILTTTSTPPDPTPTPTTTQEPAPLPACALFNEEERLYVLSTDIFFSWGPTDEEIDQVLVDAFPSWANFRQSVSWQSEPATVGEIIEEASLFEETFALNPAVTLVTLGVSLDWQLPPDGDLYSQALATGKKLVHLWDEWTHPDNEHIRVRYPNLANDGATYALYTFFNQDIEKLQTWCETYQKLFEASPLHR